MLKDRVSSVKLAHPMRVKAIASARIKTDKIDSEILAELLACDLIPEAHIRIRENREKQTVLRQRASFVATRTRVKNRIHVLVDRQPYEIRKTAGHLTDLFGKAGMDWLRNVKELSKNDRILLDQMLELLNNLNTLIEKTNKIINEFFNNDRNAQLLVTIPGIRKFLAVLISTEIDDIERFSSAKKLASYTGLVPSTYSSANITRHGRIIKQGNKWLRWAFVEAAKSAKRYNTQLNEYFNQISKRKGINSATVALARRIVTIAFSILHNQRLFEIYKKS
jgi:transposase